MTNSAKPKVKNNQNGAIKTRSLLLSEAAKLFALRGYNKTSMRDLADAVGMKAGSIFYHFKNKDEILFEVMKASIIALLKNTEQGLSEIDELDQRLKVLVKCELEHYMGDHKYFSTVLIHEWRSLPTDLQAEILVMRSTYESRWRDVLNECHQYGLIKANPVIIRRMLNGAFSWVNNWYQKDGIYDSDELAEQVMLMLLCSDKKCQTKQ